MRISPTSSKSGAVRVLLHLGCPVRNPILRSMATVATLAALCAAAATSVLAQNPAVTINVDVTANRRPINPDIYGVAHATTVQLNDLNSPLNRNGGNNTTRYNWQANADNRGKDWYFESIGDSSATAGERGDTFFSVTRAANASPMLTIPTLGWVAKLGAGRSKLASFSIEKYGPQTGNDSQWFPDAGNGVRTSGLFVVGNDPDDASMPSDAAFQRGWVQHLVNSWGTAATGGLRHYILDNEPSIWHRTHRDVHPIGATMDEVRDKIIEYAGDDQRHRSGGGDRGPLRSGAGAVTSTAATIRSTAAPMATACSPIAEATATPTTCRGCSINSVNKK